MEDLKISDEEPVRPVYGGGPLAWAMAGAETASSASAVLCSAVSRISLFAVKFIALSSLFPEPQSQLQSPNPAD